MPADVMLPTPSGIAVAMLVLACALVLPLVVTGVLHKFFIHKIKNKIFLITVNILIFFALLIFYAVIMGRILRNPEYDRIVNHQDYKEVKNSLTIIERRSK